MPLAPLARTRSRATPIALWLGATLVTACASHPPTDPVRTKPAPEPSIRPVPAAPPAVSAIAPVPIADAGADADAGPAPGERWTDAHVSAASCPDYRSVPSVYAYQDPYGPNRKFTYDGYFYRHVAVARVIEGAQRTHCLKVYHPKGPKTAEGKPVRIAHYIDAAWYRLLENTLARLPWLHLQTVHAFVIDDRPILHGIASFARGAASEDARDGHTIWLNQRLFTQANHWGPGNYGRTWSYHVQRDGEVVDNKPGDHDMFSPVIVHEIGHLVNYTVINGSAADPSCPPCAFMCGDHKTCEGATPAQKEAPCATAYCTGFGYASGTENWAEMYRWFYQGSQTRAMLASSFAACFDVLDDEVDGDGINAGLPAPWELGLGEVTSYRKTLWDSCDRKACKPY